MVNSKCVLAATNTMSKRRVDGSSSFDGKTEVKATSLRSYYVCTRPALKISAKRIFSEISTAAMAIRTSPESPSRAGTCRAIMACGHCSAMGTAAESTVGIISKSWKHNQPNNNVFRTNTNQLFKCSDQRYSSCFAP